MCRYFVFVSLGNEENNIDSHFQWYILNFVTVDQSTQFCFVILPHTLDFLFIRYQPNMKYKTFSNVPCECFITRLFFGRWAIPQNRWHTAAKSRTVHNLVINNWDSSVLHKYWPLKPFSFLLKIRLTMKPKKRSKKRITSRK